MEYCLSLGLMRNSIDFFFFLSKKGFVYLQNLIIYCVKRSYFVCCNIFFEGRFSVFLFGSVCKTIGYVQKFGRRLK